MSVTKTRGWFSKPGKGFPQVHLKDFEGNLQYKDEAKTVPLTGNEQYEADQLSADSIDATDADTFMVDVMAACGDDLNFARKAFITGWNRETRLSAGGLDDYQKAAKKILALDLPNYRGKTLDQVADLLRAQEA
jgi:hypothetical protein